MSKSVSYGHEPDSVDFINYDPRYALDIYTSNDAVGGYQNYHFKAVLAADSRGFRPNGRLDSLGRHGWAVVATGLDVVEIPDSAAEIGKTLSRTYLGACLDRNDDRIRQYFCCDYVPISLSVVRTFPGEDNVSMRWHCDSGPRRHLKMLVYLNETDGATGVIERRDTDLFVRSGYAFCGMAQRAGDNEVRQFALKQKIPFCPTHITPPPYHALLFEPSLVLHRGVAPTRGERVMLQILLVPSVGLWRDNFDLLWPLIEGNSSAGFPTMPN